MEDKTKKLPPKPRQMLKEGKSLLTEDRYAILRRSYRQQLWLQIGFLTAMVILLVISALLMGLWKKSLVTGMVFVILCTLVWSFASPYITGKVWRNYVRWYQKGQDPNTLSRIFQ